MGKPRKEFDHTSEGSAWEAESTSDGENWKPAQSHPSNRTDEQKKKPAPVRRIFGM